MYFEAPATMLEAVNVLLISVGDEIVNSVNDTGLTDATSAKTLINSVSRGIQSNGLYCNTDIDYSLQRETDNTVRVPHNTLRVLIENTDENQYALRGQKIYDRLNNTYEFEEDLVAKELVTMLPFEDLPDYVRELIIIKAVRQFQSYKLQDGSMHKFTQEDEYRAWRTFNEREEEHHQVNLLDDYYIYRVGGYRYRRIT